jgi:hypothetical protein
MRILKNIFTWNNWRSDAMKYILTLILFTTLLNAQHTEYVTIRDTLDIGGTNFIRVNSVVNPNITRSILSTASLELVPHNSVIQTVKTYNISYTLIALTGFLLSQQNLSDYGDIRNNTFISSGKKHGYFIRGIIFGSIGVVASFNIMEYQTVTVDITNQELIYKLTF